MCAIGGIFLKPQYLLDIEKYLGNMLEIQAHRGPDAQGMWLAQDKKLGLCHNRLAILDLSQMADQPMQASDGRYALVFNGEIYNYKQLHAELQKHGACFKTRSDTEVIIEAYRLWGENMLAKLRGMFSFSLYDKKEKILFCARDRVGKKPFIYAQTDTVFVFASEIPAVLQVSGVDSSYDHSAIAAIFLHNMRHIPDPYTAYQGIKRLRAGHAMIVREGKIERAWRYWTPTPGTEPAKPECLRDILEEAVSLRMQSDVPVGALLSGGVDSSFIVALMRKKHGDPIRTYALGFDRGDEDLRRARLAARVLGTCHNEFYYDAEEQWKIFCRMISVYGEPIMLLPLLHAYVLCRAIHDDGVKVVLNGNGADELFYGYTGHPRTFRISRWLDRIAPLRAFLGPLKHTRAAWVAAPPGQRKAAYYRALARKEWSICFSEAAQNHLENHTADEMVLWGDLCPSGHFIDESNFVGLMVENTHSVTTAGDLPAMMASVEMRAPFLDQEMISFALATPADLKIPDINNKDWLKAILREAARDFVPDDLLRASKRGFGMGIPEQDVLRRSWRDKSAVVFKNPHDAGGLFKPDGIRKLWQGFCEGKTSASRVAKMLAIQVWLQEA